MNGSNFLNPPDYSTVRAASSFRFHLASASWPPSRFFQERACAEAFPKGRTRLYTRPRCTTGKRLRDALLKGTHSTGQLPLQFRHTATMISVANRPVGCYYGCGCQSTDPAGEAFNVQNVTPFDVETAGTGD